MFRVRKRFAFEAAHQLLPNSAHTVCCSETIHGHSYVVEVFITQDNLNDGGMVMDFGLLKHIVQPKINEWDHALILCNRSPLLKNPGDRRMLQRTNKKLLVWPDNPTAEVMAKMLFDHIESKIDSKFDATSLHDFGVLEKVRVHETQTGWAEYCRRD